MKLYKVNIYPDKDPDITELEVLAETEWHWTIMGLDGRPTTESKASQAPWSPRATREEALDRSIKSYEDWIKRDQKSTERKINTLNLLKDLRKE
jgi:hypothetical protein